MRYCFIVPLMLVGSVLPAPAQISIGIGLPQVSIGINLPIYPELTPVPGYPVYYAPSVDGNYFFYDGMYWVYQNDDWYASSWYNGPWAPVSEYGVPDFVLRIPVRYYRRPPAMFGGWQRNAAPHWGDHWGRDWQQRRPGWDRWDHRRPPSAAALPSYQRAYSGNRYPGADQQRLLHGENYHYQPKSAVVREHYQQQNSPGRSGRPDGANRGNPAQPQPHREGQPPQQHRESQPPPQHRETQPPPQQREAQPPKGPDRQRPGRGGEQRPGNRGQEKRDEHGPDHK